MPRRGPPRWAMMPLVDPFLPDDAKLAAVRELLPSTGSGIRLDATVAGPFPSETDRALQEADDWELRVGRGGPDRADDMIQRADEARSVIAAVLSATPARIVLASGPRAALAACLAGADTRAAPASRVVVLGEVTDALLAAVRAIASARGAVVELVPGPAADAVFEGAAWLVVAAHVDAVTGVLLPVAPVAVRAHEAGALLVLDTGWSVGAVPVDGPGTGADIVLVDGYRWLLGPEGVSAAWLSERVDVARATSLLDPLPRASLLGLARSVGWLLMYVGLPWAFERAERLTGRLYRALSEVSGVELLGPPRGLATTVSFRIGGWPADEAATELGRRCFAVLDIDERRDVLRAGVSAWLREDELDRFVAAVGDLAAHTPDTLPRRPMLTLLGDDPDQHAR
jgi:selenocysteine lyase/cysteine desulfurase